MAWLPAIVGMSFLQDAHPVQANMLEDFTRKAMRPDLEYMQALIMLLDARSVLREVEVWSLMIFQQLIMRLCLEDGGSQSIQQR